LSEPTTSAPIKPLVIALLQLARQDEQALVTDFDATERAAIGTPKQWSPRDLIGHIAAWRARQIGKLVAATRGESLPVWRENSVIDALNAETFAATQRQSWDEVQAEAGRAYAGLLAQVEMMIEEQLTQPTASGEPLWPETLGNGCWHPYTHMMQHYRERGELPPAIALFDPLRAELARLSAPETMIGDTVYNLACLYASAGEADQALALLHEALRLHPELVEWACNDLDLASLQGRPEFEALVQSRDGASKLITPADLASQRAGHVAPVVVDARGSEEYAKGHIQGALNIPRERLEERMGELPRDREVVTYCMMQRKGASRGERAATLLRARGYTARALDGGLPAWSAAGHPTDKGA
jgi:rhodanese-related sulfurtransferase